MAETTTPAAGAESASDAQQPETLDFIRAIVAEDLRRGTHGGKVVTRFPPEPNGYLHIGHAKSIALNFGIAEEFGGICNLRFDDTNPETEDMEYVESIQRDIRWLGFEWANLRFASDYYQQMYDWAEQLIRDGNAYVDDLNEQEIREYRGTVTEPGRESPWRNRSVEENLDLFRRMRAGEFPDGAKVLRGKCDMASPNMKMRDPLLYRIRHESHFRTGDTWCIYPMYDYAHPLEDLIEDVTHSICTLEFENNREIYDWLLDALVPEPRPHQYEFARLNIDYTVMSKRKLLQLVEEGHVQGWDDPRMPTIAGMRRRGVTPSALRAFCERIGVAKANSRVEIGLFEATVRDDLNPVAPRVLAVINPLKVTIENWPEGEIEWLDAPYYPADVPGDPNRPASRKLPFGRNLCIEQSDFMENPPANFYRLAPGREVRLRHGYIITCTDVVRDESGLVTELRCTYDPATRSGAPALNPDGSKRKTQTAIHWVEATHALPAEVRLYDRLLQYPDPDAEGIPFLEALNPRALEIMPNALVEPSVAEDAADTRYQFERHGYFWRDQEESTPERLVFNRIVGLRDSWAKVVSSQPASARAAERGDKGKAKESAPAEGEGKPRIIERSSALQEAWQRYMREYGLPDEDAEILTRDAAVATFFEQATDFTNNARALANWVTHEVLAESKGKALGDLNLTPEALAEIVNLVDEGVISNAAARTVLAEVMATGNPPRFVVDTLGLRQVSDSNALLPIVEQVVQANADKAAQYRAGKTGLLGFFTGQVMKETRGAADAKVVQELLLTVLTR